MQSCFNLIFCDFCMDLSEKPCSSVKLQSLMLRFATIYQTVGSLAKVTILLFFTAPLMYWIPAGVVISATECLRAVFTRVLTGLLQSPLSSGKQCYGKHVSDLRSIFCARVSSSRNEVMDFFEKPSGVQNNWWSWDAIISRTDIGKNKLVSLTLISA